MSILWFLCALLPPFLHSLSALVDQYIIRIHTAASPFSFLALAGITCLPVVIFLYPFVDASPDFSLAHAPFIILTGALFSACVIPYFYAVEGEDGHIVVPLFQMTPALVAVLGWVFLGETLGPLQIVGGLVIITAAAASLIDFHHLTFKARSFFLIFMSSCLYAIFFTSLRAVALDTDWMVVTYWLCTGWFLEGVLILIFVPSIRASLFQKIRATKGRLYALGTAQQFFDIGANASFAAALSFAAYPAAVTDLVSGVQPFVIAFFGFWAARFFPHIYSFETTRRVLIQKVICFLTIILGLYLVLGIG